MSRLGDLTLRAAGFKPALGNLKQPSTGGGRGQVSAGTSPITFVSEGQPLNVDYSAEEAAKVSYGGNTYVMRCVRLIAETIGGLPWVAGADPTSPEDYDPGSKLADLLGPATPQAPGGPNPVTAARALWIWSIAQYLVTGRFGWETQLAGPKSSQEIIGLWPLVSACLAPKPVYGGTQWFDGYEYRPATGPVQLKNEQVIYCWRPSISDWRLPESVLQAAAVPVYIVRSVEKYIANLLKNGMVATTMVVTPPFAEADLRRSWQDQFLAEFTGVDRAGQTIFGEIDFDEGDNPNAKPIQVEHLATSFADADMRNTAADAKNDICIALGVPRSLIGDASQRTYANASSEYKNFWTLTVLDLIAELQDQVNMALAPRIGTDVGWFDLSRVEAVQPPSFFAPPDVASIIMTGVATPAQVASILGIDALTNAPTDSATVGPHGAPSDTYTVGTGSESSTPGPQAAAATPGGKRWLDRDELLIRAMQHPELARMLDEAQHRMHAPINTWTLQGKRKPWKPLERERLVTPELYRRHRHALSTTGPGIERAQQICQRVEGTRALMSADAKAKAERAQLVDEVRRIDPDLVVYLDDRHDFAPLGTGKNWVTEVGGLPPMIRDIAHALIRHGSSESTAIATAIAACKRWAAGGGKVHPDTRARAAAAVAQWEAMKAGSHAKSGVKALAKGGGSDD